MDGSNMIVTGFSMEEFIESMGGGSDDDGFDVLGKASEPLLLNLSRCDAKLEIMDDSPTSIGFPNGKPSEVEWVEVKAEVERLLGYEIVTWGAFTNPATKWFWTEIGNAAECEGSSSPLSDAFVSSMKS